MEHIKWPYLYHCLRQPLPFFIIIPLIWISCWHSSHYTSMTGIRRKEAGRERFPGSDDILYSPDTKLLETCIFSCVCYDPEQTSSVVGRSGSRPWMTLWSSTTFAPAFSTHIRRPCCKTLGAIQIIQHEHKNVTVRWRHLLRLFSGRSCLGLALLIQTRSWLRIAGLMTCNNRFLTG